MTTFLRRLIVSLSAITLSTSAALAGQTSASPDLLASKQVRELVATAKAPADHLKLQRHFLAMAKKYDAEAEEHVADAQAYRKNPTFHEGKHPAGPGTAVHCDRFADLARQAAKEARELAAAHEQMAKAK